MEEKLTISQIMAKSFDEWTEEEAELMRKHEEYNANLEREKEEKKERMLAEARAKEEAHAQKVARADRQEQNLKELKETNPVAYFLYQVHQQETRRPYKLNITAEQATQMLRAAYMAEVQRMGREPELMSNIEEAIQRCGRWLTDTRLKPGLVMMGNVGTGKTTLLHAIKMVVEAMDEKRRKMEIEGASEMVKMYRSDNKRFDAWTYSPLLGIDDLGTEATTVKDYGNDTTPMSDMLLNRYKRRPFTVITTNLLEKELEPTYGPRVYSRLCEWCQFMEFGSKEDYRKINRQTEMFK